VYCFCCCFAVWQCFLDLVSLVFGTGMLPRTMAEAARCIFFEFTACFFLFFFGVIHYATMVGCCVCARMVLLGFLLLLGSVCFLSLLPPQQWWNYGYSLSVPFLS